MNKLIFVICLLSVPIAHAARISMLEEGTDIECTFAKGKGPYDRILIDRKEAWIKAFKNGQLVQNFDSFKFLDTAFLAKSEKSVALFQIFPNGQVAFTEGELLPLLQKNCDDTGASKTCANEGIKKLFWTPEKLQLTTKSVSYSGQVDQYGALAGHGTYFHSANNKQALTLLNYGAALELVIGPHTAPACSYSKE